MTNVFLLGATGYTGRLVARAMVERGMRPVLAGRRPAALAELGDALGLETAEADVDRPETVRALLARDDTIVSTAGPFTRLGPPVVQAAAEAGARYLDCAGESSFIRDVFERHDRPAQRNGAALVPAFGFDWVPGNLLATIALEAAGNAATAVEVTYFVSWSASSGGTRASSLCTLLAPHHRWHGGALRDERAAARTRRIAVGDGRLLAASFGGSEHLTLPRLHPHLQAVDVWLGGPAVVVALVRCAATVVGGAVRVPGVGARIRDAVAARATGGGGPDELHRALQGGLVVARASDAAGRVLAEAQATGVSPYDVSARLLAWGAEQAANGGIRGTGALGPVEAFGLERVRAGAEEAGLRLSAG